MKPTDDTLGEQTQAKQRLYLEQLSLRGDLAVLASDVVWRLPFRRG